ATFLAPSGRPKFLVATDHLESEELKGLTHEDLFDVIVRRDLHFDQARQRGVVFHMMSALTELGRIGLTAVGASPEMAQQIYRDADAAWLGEGRESLSPSALPPLAVRAPVAGEAADSRPAVVGGHQARGFPSGM